MFQGFNDSTIKYYNAIRNNNSKSTYKENEMLYLEGVKYPLEEMYFELYHYFLEFDRDLLGSKRKCLSSAYNDARFCGETPIKEYFYIRFKLNSLYKKNIPGFFFDASLDGYKYGLNLYNLDGRGMEKIRGYILDNKNFSKKAIIDFNKTGLLELMGEKYKKPRYQTEDSVLQDWLERKQISFIHEERIQTIFYEREILDQILSAFHSVKEVYFMLKEAI